MSSASNLLDSLFPIPSLSPYSWPGRNAESTSSLQKALKDNHDRWHIFFNDKGFHNHAAHHLLAIYALGASAPIIDAAYETHVVYQRPAIESPAPITADTFHDHLGQDEYYRGYLAFFTDALLKNGAAATLEEYVFSLKANFDPAREGQCQPEFLNRFVGGLLHPMIHVGYGLEFGLLGTLAEGLAQAAVHKARYTIIIPRALFKESQGPVDTAVDRLTSIVPSLKLSPASTSDVRSPAGTHIFTIMARMLKDPELKVKKPDPASSFITDIYETHGARILKYVEQWTLDTSDPKDVERKIEELIWMNTLIYGVGGWNKANGFKANFFLMHLVTSSSFLPSITCYLNPASQNAFLRAYVVMSLLLWVVMGRPSFDFSGYYASTDAHPLPPNCNLTPDSSTLPSPTSPHAVTPNPWLPLIQTTIVHPGEHFCKIQRAFAHFSCLYGSRAAGQADFVDTELEGAEKLDGTLFVRVAAETANRLGWLREGEKAGGWERDGFYDDA